jgi:endonuclease YncB( thermonuclease family)
MKPRLIALFSVMLLLPLGLRLATPTLLEQGMKLRNVFPFGSTQQQYIVESVDGYTLTLHTRNQAQFRVRLAGLQSGSDRWQKQAAVVTAMLLHSSGAKVQLTGIQSLGSSEEIQAIAQLPNGTPLQQVLLADGLAKLDHAQLKQLPLQFAQPFQKAEASARSQQKNIWASVSR